MSRAPLPRRRFVQLIGVTLLVTACDRSTTTPPAPESIAEPKPVAKPSAGDLTFPRTATTFLGQDSLPSPSELARYDVAVIDNEWPNREPPSYFAELRRLNPRLTLLAYVNLVDAVHETGTPQYWPNGYRLWRISPSDPTKNSFPDAWLAKRADGTPVHEFEDRVMTNLTDAGPRVDGQLFVEYAMDWVVDTVWAAGIWDGIYLDVWGDRIWSADSDHWDIHGDGRDEPDAQIYGADNPWGRGLLIGEKRLRAALPNAIVVANGDRTLTDGLLNGRVFESFTDARVRGAANTDLSDYIASASSTATRQPPMPITINRQRETPGSRMEFQRARFALAATLMEDGFWAPMGADYSTVAYYDEMDGAGLGRGYLGHPLTHNENRARTREHRESAAGSPSDGVFRRDFEHGIVVLNASPETVTVPLGGNFTKLKGTQDPLTNDGAKVDSVVIAPMDAIVLLR